MNLYIDCIENNKGWESFDFIINKQKLSDNKLTLSRFTGDGYESVKVAECDYSVSGRYMTVKVKKSDLSIENDSFTLNFACTDNVHDENDEAAFTGDIMQFYATGDVAPGGRFKYCYKAQ